MLDVAVCQDLSPVCHQKDQDFILHRRQVHRFPMDINLPFFKIHLQVIHPECVILYRSLVLPVPQGGPDTCQKFLCIAGFCHKVIGPAVQGLHHGGFICFGCHDDNRDPGFLADQLQHLHSIHVRKDQVKQHHIRMPCIEKRQPPQTVPSLAEPVILRTCGMFHKFLHDFIIMDDKDRVLIHIPPTSWIPLS